VKRYAGVWEGGGGARVAGQRKTKPQEKPAGAGGGEPMKDGVGGGPGRVQGETGHPPQAAKIIKRGARNNGGGKRGQVGLGKRPGFSRPTLVRQNKGRPARAAIGDHWAHMDPKTWGGNRDTELANGTEAKRGANMMKKAPRTL